MKPPTPWLICKHLSWWIKQWDAETGGYVPAWFAAENRPAQFRTFPEALAAYQQGVAAA